MEVEKAYVVDEDLDEHDRPGLWMKRHATRGQELCNERAAATKHLAIVRRGTKLIAPMALCWRRTNKSFPIGGCGVRVRKKSCSTLRLCIKHLEGGDTVDDVKELAAACIWQCDYSQLLFLLLLLSTLYHMFTTSKQYAESHRE